MPLEEICKQRRLPRQYLVKLFALLARANLIESVRGKGGGYLLAKPPSEITLLEVVEAIEGPLAVNLCQSNPPKCDQTQCRVRVVWAELQETVRTALAKRTLQEFVDGKVPQPLGQK